MTNPSLSSLSTIDFLILISPLIVIAIILLALVVQKYINRRTSSPSDDNIVSEDTISSAQARLNSARQQHLARLRRTGASGSVEGNDEEDDEGELDDENDELDSRPKKIGKKKAEKLRRKEEMKRYREWQVAQQEDRRRREELIEEENRRREERKGKERQKEEERERKRQLERQREEELRRKTIEKEEANKKAFDEVREELIQHIKERKVITFDEISSQYNVPSTCVHETLRNLDSLDRITGILDENCNRYVYISPEALAEIADTIVSRGNVLKEEIRRMIMAKISGVENDPDKENDPNWKGKEKLA